MNVFVLAYLFCDAMVHASTIYILKCRYYSTHVTRISKNTFHSVQISNPYLEAQYKEARYRLKYAGDRVQEQQLNTIYYIGKTDDLTKRLEKHRSGKVKATKFASKWLLWDSFEDYQVSPLDPSQAEDIVFFYVVKKIGRKISESIGLNVKGATFATARKFDAHEQHFIRKMILHQRGRCFNCLSQHHMAGECKEEVSHDNTLNNYFLKNIRNGRLLVPENSVRFLRTLGEEEDDRLGFGTRIEWDSDRYGSDEDENNDTGDEDENNDSGDEDESNDSGDENENNEDIDMLSV